MHKAILITIFLIISSQALARDIDKCIRNTSYMFSGTLLQDDAEEMCESDMPIEEITYLVDCVRKSEISYSGTLLSHTAKEVCESDMSPEEIAALVDCVREKSMIYSGAYSHFRAEKECKEKLIPKSSFWDYIF